MKTYAFVIARGDTDTKKDKSSFVLDGDKLYVRQLNILLNCKEIDKIILDTNSQEMFDAVNYLPIEHLKRQKELIFDNVTSKDLLLNEVEKYNDADLYLQISPTFPFVKAETIDNAIKLLKESSNNDSLVFVKKEKLFKWENDKPAYKNDAVKADLQDTISETMGFAIIKKEVAIKKQDRLGYKPIKYEVSSMEAVECNNKEDLFFANIIAKGLKQQEISNFRLLKHFATSALISDILDDMELKYKCKCGGVINNFKCNIKNVKLLGRASTLKIRKLEQNENFKGIYDALESYKYIGENDIICVENELSENAYFGDLNARLAIRAGAQGAIINGATRDKNSTISLNFPVFAKTYNSQDVRRRGTLDYFNKPIMFGNVKISPKDLIFIDDCSMTVIYKEYEQEIIETMIDLFINEKNIANAILNDTDTNEIVETFGTF